MFHRAFTSIKGRSLQSIIVILILLVALTIEFIGNVLLSAVKETKFNVMRQIGAKVNISQVVGEVEKNSSITGGKVIDEEMLSFIKNIDHVNGLQQVVSLSMKPINFENVKLHTGYDPSEQNDKSEVDENITKENKDSISINGCIDYNMEDEFYRGHNVITKGKLDKNISNYAIISQQLADQNDLDIGDTISIKRNTYMSETLKDETITLIVTAIYQTDLTFDVLDTNFAGDGIYSASPYNIIYTDYYLVESITGNNQTGLNAVNIIIDDPNNIQSVTNIIKNSDMFQEFEIYNLTDAIYKQYAYNLNNVYNRSENISIMTMILSILIILLIFSLWSNDNYHDTGIYLSIGYSKNTIIIQKLIEMVILSIIAFSLAIIITVTSINTIFNLLDVQYVNSLNTVSCFVTGIDNINFSFTPSINLYLIIDWLLFTFLLSGFSLIIPFFTIIRFKPYELICR
jgi:putative ABC transport system permease protein